MVPVHSTSTVKTWNLCYLEGFDVAAEWNFFASFHGNNPVSGIGGTVKGLQHMLAFKQLRQTTF